MAGKTGVLDAGVPIGWLLGGHRSQARLERLFQSSRAGQLRLVISMVNLAEVFEHAVERNRRVGSDPLAILLSHGVQLHSPDVEVARQVARLPTSLADGFAAATALTFGARLHTTDRELARQVRGRLDVTLY